MQWLNDNREWVFSGIGVLVISVIMSSIWYLLFKKKASGRSQNARAGNNSTIFQAGRDINKKTNTKRRK
jgi:hypothetical protein